MHRAITSEVLWPVVPAQPHILQPRCGKFLSLRECASINTDKVIDLYTYTRVPSTLNKVQHLFGHNSQSKYRMIAPELQKQAKEQQIKDTELTSSLL